MKTPEQWAAECKAEGRGRVIFGYEGEQPATEDEARAHAQAMFEMKPREIDGQLYKFACVLGEPGPNDVVIFTEIHYLPVEMSQ